jgi:methyl-accepting chemotaxis protein
VLADKAGMSLKEIIAGAEKVVDVITRVAAASEEQSSTSEEISKNIEGINNVTRESSAGIQSIAEASEELNKLTLNLQKLVSKFKIDNVHVEEKEICSTFDNVYKYEARENGIVLSK